MSRGLLASRISQLVARPGIDTRYHLKLAIVDDIVVDPNEGIFADISLLPNEEPETAFMGVPYAGGGYGLYMPLQVDDTVLIAIPDGDCSQGPIIIARMWDAGDKPFPEMQGAAIPGLENQYEPAQLVVLRAKPGTDTVIIVSAGANITLKVEGAGNVNLNVAGGTVNLGMSEHTALQGVVQGEAFDSFTGATQTALGNTSSKVFARKS